MFRPNSKVLAYHGPLIYEAKVLKVHEQGKYYVENSEGKQESVTEINFPMELIKDNAYLLHYKGWNLKWDEWVGNARLMEFNEESLRLKKQVLEQFKQQFQKPLTPQPANGADANGKPNGADKPGNNKRKLNRSDTKGELKLKKKKTDIVLPISDKLKYLLVDDWEFVTKDRRIIQLPVKNPIKTILQEYTAYEIEVNRPTPEHINIMNEFQIGLSAYFNQAVRLILLYKYERLQYGDLIKANGSDIDLCEYYGIEHLLRLFISLPGLISQTSMDSPSITTMMTQSNNLLQYLDKTFNKYFNEYDYTHPAYDSLSRS